MLSSAKNWVEDKAAGLLKTGIQAGGTLAGNAVGGVGSMVESAGRSAGQGVAGGIGGVGSRINGYGEGIKRSMSADGPVSSGEKKTAVKPSTSAGKTAPAAQKTLASAGTAKKTVPSTGGAQKTASPTALQKSGSTIKPAQQLPKTSTAGASRSKSAPIQPPQGVGSGVSKPKPGGPSTARTENTGGGSKLPSNTSKPAANLAKPQSKSTADGKIRISPESRPRPATSTPAARTTARQSTGPAKKHHASDPLGIGENIGDMSKTKPKGNETKSQSQSQSHSQSQSAAARKPSAGDPLALGEDIGNIGKKK